MVIRKKADMNTQTSTQLIQWQNLKVVSETDIVLNLAQQKGWKDCKVFGHGPMITQPQQSKGWKLIPADLYEYSIPAKGVDRLLKIIDAGVHIQGVIIADDMRKMHQLHTPAMPVASLPSANTVLSTIGRVLLGLATLVGVILLGLIILKAYFLLLPLFLLSSAFGFDPQLIILVDAGDGEMAWISVLTWYD